MALLKAYLLNDDTGEQLECQFNPEQYKLTKTVNVSSDPNPATETGNAQFRGGDPATLNFTLHFDTYQGPEMQMKDVRTEYTDKLLALMRRAPSTLNADRATQTGRTPIVSFHWGRTWSFKGMITNCTLTFTLFNSLGTPVRANADVSMKQVVPAGAQRGQNPTSGGDGMRAHHVVEPGDTLDLIAYREYGDAARWRLLADANGIDNPRVLRPGQRLIVPNN